MMSGPSVAALVVASLALAAASGPGAARPAMGEFVGVCGHFGFDGPTYAPAAAWVRNYHALNWDLDVARPYREPPYPFALNRVNWQRLYGGWRRAGLDVTASLAISQGPAAEAWVEPAQAARAYGRDFARFFGPGGTGLLSAVELGNEPGKDAFPDPGYVAIARALAEGLREGDPDLPVATAALTLGESDDYARSVACYEGWLDLIDILNVHTYAMVGQWPDRRRTHPEDPECGFLGRVREVLAWRDARAPGKAVWVTEFGWDAHRPGGASVPEGVPIDRRASAVSRLQQAQFLVRAYLIFARMGVERAAMFWYRDDGPEAGMHNASGLISGGRRQPAFHALASLRRTLNGYRFAGAAREEPGELYAYRFADEAGRACVAVWRPTWAGAPRRFALSLEEFGLSGHELTGAVELALSEEGERPVEAARCGDAVRVEAAGTPRLLFFEPRTPAVEPEGG